MEARQAKNKMEEKALTTSNYVAIASTLQEIQRDVATQINMPLLETIVKLVKRYKRKLANALPHIPHGVDFETLEKFKDFVALDKGKDETGRFIIFALTEMLLLFETTTVLWLSDETFKNCPDMFYGLFTIHVTLSGSNPPSIYALLPKKTEKTYHDFTKALLQWIRNANPQIKMIDIEKVAVITFSTTFPAAQTTGFYFHLCQSVLRRKNQIGLKKAYKKTPELVLTLKMVPATDFLPVEQVEQNFNLVIEEASDIFLRFKSDDEVSRTVEQIACYF